MLARSTIEKWYKLIETIQIDKSYCSQSFSVNFFLPGIVYKYDKCVYGLILIKISQPGNEQHVYVAKMPNQHDGSADNHGPIATRCRTHGGKNHICHVNV